MHDGLRDIQRIRSALPKRHGDQFRVLAMKFKLEGVAELEAALKELTKATVRNTLRRALIKAAEPMRAAAAQNAPEDTGGLKRGIQIGTKIAKDKSRDPGSRAFAATMTGGGSRAEAVQALRDARRAQGVGETFAEVFLGPVRATKKNSIKAIAQEFGSVNHPAHPYMRPAFDVEAIPTLKRLEGHLKTEIAKSVSRARAPARRGRQPRGSA